MAKEHSSHLSDQEVRDILSKEVGNVDDSHSHRLLKEHVEDVFQVLNDRERQVMRSRFGLDDGNSKTYSQVGEEIHRSVRTVQRIERIALQKLRQPSVTQPLKDYLG